MREDRSPNSVLGSYLVLFLLAWNAGITLLYLDNLGIGKAMGGPFVAIKDVERPGFWLEKTALDGNAPLKMGKSGDRWDYYMRALKALPLGAPLDGDYVVTGQFGPRRDPFDGRVSTHTGLDLAAPHNTPVKAAGAGRVSFAGWQGDYGRVVEIDHGMGVVTRYAHLRSVAVAEGNWVKDGSLIGKIGTSGRSTGPHLHYEVIVGGALRDPADLIETGKRLIARRPAES